MQKQELKEEQEINLIAADEETDTGSAADPRADVSGQPEGGNVEKPEGPGVIVDGRYELLALVGTGGMSKVYRARDLTCGSAVALKLINSDYLQDPRAHERFQNEAALVCRLNHPNVAVVRESGTASDGSVYLVMDYIEGITVQELLCRNGAQPREKALKIIMQVCRGLKEAHAQDIVHRDLKPSNIILEPTADGQEEVRIVDFGIARVLEQTGNAHMPLTETNEMLGTPWYMSPEQCFGKLSDRRTDIYQLGCLLYELLSGKKPFEGSTAFEVMFKHVTGVPGLDELPKDLRAIVEKALNKNPDERYQSVDDFVQELQLAEANYNSKKENRATDAAYRDLVSRPTSTLDVILPRRLGAAALDALIIATTFSLMVVCLNAAKILRNADYICWNGFPDVLNQAGKAFTFGIFDSFLVWPAAILSLLPADLHWRISEYIGLLRDIHFDTPWDMNLVPLLLFLLNWLYHALFESSRLGATPGKVIFGLKVLTGVSQPLTFFKATQRHFARAFSMLMIPEIIRFTAGIAKRNKRSVKTQLSWQLRTPLHDALSSCAVSIKASKARKVTGAVLLSLGLILVLSGLRWEATSLGMFDLALLVDKNFVAAREGRATDYLNKGKFNEALQDLTQAQKLFPSRREIYEKQAAAFVQLQKFDAAVQALDNGITKCDRQGKQQLMASKAKILAGLGNYRAAREVLQQLPADRVDPIFAAYLSEKFGESSDAQVLFKIADDFFRGDLTYYSAEYARKREHTNPAAYQNRAIVAAALGRDNALALNERAIADCKYVDEHERPHTSTKYIKGSAYLLHGQLTGGASASRQALENDFNKAVESFTEFINKQHDSPDDIEQIQTLGKAYLGRAEAYASLGKNALSEKDRAAAGKLGVTFNFHCNSNRWWF
jgi:tetratricopeptide (TPR) repeat protein/uncharacterized RDD family membrane protein YckC